MDWTVIILALFEAIRKCIEDRNKETAKARLLRGGLACAGPIRRALRRSGLGGADLREATVDAIVELEAMTPQDIDDLIEDAEQAAGTLSPPIHVTTKG